MQIPPITFTDASLLFTVGVIILLITSELISSYYGQTNLSINKRKLRNAAFIVGIIFLITIAINVLTIISV